MPKTRTAPSTVRPSVPFHLQPVGDRILVLRDKQVEVTPGGVILAAEAQEAPVEGVVLAVGPGRRLADGTLIQCSLPVGARVLFTAYAGTKLPGQEVDGQELLAMTEGDVLCVRAAGERPAS